MTTHGPCKITHDTHKEAAYEACHGIPIAALQRGVVREMIDLLTDFVECDMTPDRDVLDAAAVVLREIKGDPQ